MRLFLAVELPAPLRQSLARLRVSLDPDGSRARWVRPESLHLTLAFLGEVDSERVESIQHALTAIRSEQIHIVVQGVGFFPNIRSPRVLWVGIVSEGLQAVVVGIRQRLVEIGFPREARAFLPHLTLARAGRKGTIGRTLVEAAIRLSETEFGSFSANRVCLFRSHLQKSGAVHEKLSEFVFSSMA